MKTRAYEKVILAIELVGFFAVLAIIWLDEFVDVPFRYFGAAQTPPRPEEYWFETIGILILGGAVVGGTLWVLQRLRHLERFIRVCAWCGKIRVGETWVSFEEYMKMRHDVKSRHGICPACRANASTARSAAASNSTR